MRAIAKLIALSVVMISTTCIAQTEIQNMYGAGVSYSVNAKPAIAGTALYAHSLNNSGTYAFSVIDALPNTINPFTITTNVGVGVAQRIATLGKVPIYAPAATGFSWTGSNFGWSYNAGFLASIHIKNNFYIMPTARFSKSSVSNGTGLQPIIGVLLGWGK